MLTDADCKNASCSPDKKRNRLTDSGNLYLEVTPNGKKRWFWKYWIDKKEKRLALGSYPAVGVKAARNARDAAKAEKTGGTDPVIARQQEKTRQALTTDNTFQAVALEWHAKQTPRWSESHASRVLVWLKKDLFPYFGNRAMETIAAPDVLNALHRIEQRGAIETAHRVLQVAGQVWTYWLPTAPATQRNITDGLKSRLQPYMKRKFAAIVDPVRFGELLRAMRQYKGGIVVKTALLLAPLLYQRPRNLREMKWCDLDLIGGLWTIPSAKMKRSVSEKEHGDDHVVPLPRQAIALLQAIQPVTGHRRYVFTNERSNDRPISDNSVRTALYSLGFGKEQTWHGFRSSGRTMGEENLNINIQVLEAQLAHAVKDANGRSYNRTTHLKNRVRSVQKWADYLDRLESRKQADILTLPNRAA